MTTNMDVHFYFLLRNLSLLNTRLQDSKLQG